MKKEKHIKIKGNKWSLHAIAIRLPGKDISISLNIGRSLTQDEVEDEVASIKTQVKDWFEDSRLLDPEHFICVVRAPSAYKIAGKHSMVIIVDISVMARNQIGMGTEFCRCWKDEMIRLVEEIGLLDKE